MKRYAKLVSMLVILAVLSVSMAGCFGNFALTKKVYQFNKGVGDKYVQTAVFWLFTFVPVYSAAGFIDAAFLNLIQFWTGNNPLALSETPQIKYSTVGNEKFKMTATSSKIIVEQTTGADAGKTLTLSYHADDATWKMDNGNKEITIARVDNDKMTLLYPNGKELTVSLR